MIEFGTFGLLGGRFVEGFADNILISPTCPFAFAVVFFTAGFGVVAFFATGFFVFAMIYSFISAYADFIFSGD
jgi:hypothetical protein